MRFAFIFGAILIVSLGRVDAQHSGSVDESYLSWTSAQAELIAKSTTQTGKAGGSFDSRIISTNTAINYHFRATLLTPEVIRGTARYYQLNNRVNDDDTRKLVEEAENAGHLVVIVEINPNEGSGVIPLDWRVFLQPKGLRAGEKGAIQGIKSPQLKKLVGLNGVTKRNYKYDIFWVTFPLVDDNKSPLISPDVGEIQLVVGIYSKEGQVIWRMPESIRDRIRILSKK